MEDKVLWNEIMEQTPLKRWMTVEEAADWAYFMTVTNRFCTGQNILIDGLEAGNAHSYGRKNSSKVAYIESGR
mgnify:FL=1